MPTLGCDSTGGNQRGPDEQDAPETGTPCPNCDAHTSGPFCAACGQRADADLRSLGFWLRDVLDETVSLNGRLPRTLAALAFRPGHLTVEWREGRRAGWLAPFRLYLLASLLFFTCSVVFPMAGSFSVAGVPAADLAMRDAVRSAQEAALAMVAPQVLILAVPFLALLFRIAFWGRGRFFVEHLVHALHVQSFWLVLLLASFLAPLLPQLWVLGLALLVQVGLWGYAGLSAHRVYGVGRLRAFLTSAGVLVVYTSALLVGFALAVTAVASDPTDPVVLAESGYWAARDRWEGGDTVNQAAVGQSIATRYRRLEAHLWTPEISAHAAEMLLVGDSVADARTLAEQGLVRSPDDPLLLRVAGRAALEAEDYEAALRFYTRLSALDAGAWETFVDSRHLPDLVRAVARADSIIRSGSPGGVRPRP